MFAWFTASAPHLINVGGVYLTHTHLHTLVCIIALNGSQCLLAACRTFPPQYNQHEKNSWQRCDDVESTLIGQF